MPFGRTISLRRSARGALALAGLSALGGCFGMRSAPPPRYGHPLLVNQVVRILNEEEPSPAYFRERARLEIMGPELDAVLVGLVEDESAEDHVRANAATLLADRQAPGAVDLLRRQLASSGSDVLRAAAVRILQRYADTDPGAHNALRAAAGDPSATVRLNVLQRLDVEDAPLVRGLLAREGDAQVRTIARQLLELLEARGARLVRDPRGDLRSSGRENLPQIVFHPTWVDPVGGVEVGALWVELPGASSSLVPLAQDVEVVDEVVPAFFDPNRTIIVYEAGREVHVRDLRGGQTRSLGPGLAPRVIPFTEHIVFVREAPGGTGADADATVVDYEVVRASFSAGGPEVIGRLSARISQDVHRGASPVRWMVVGEASNAFVLRAPGFAAPFVLPGPFETPGATQ